MGSAFEQFILRLCSKDEHFLSLSHDGRIGLHQAGLQHIARAMTSFCGRRPLAWRLAAFTPYLQDDGTYSLDVLLQIAGRLGVGFSDDAIARLRSGLSQRLSQDLQQQIRGEPLAPDTLVAATSAATDEAAEATTTSRDKDEEMAALKARNAELLNENQRLKRKVQRLRQLRIRKRPLQKKVRRTIEKKESIIKIQADKITQATKHNIKRGTAGRYLTLRGGVSGSSEKDCFQWFFEHDWAGNGNGCQ